MKPVSINWKLALILAAATASSAAAQTNEYLTPTVTASVESIDEGMFVAINRLEQWIAIRGDDKRNPVLLWVHGGPGGGGGSFAMPMFREWERDYTVVQWDQPGAG